MTECGGIFAGISAFIVICQTIEQWQLRRTDKRRLTEMRKQFSMGHRWEHCGVSGDIGLKVKK
jgi:hypothetical protein